MEEIKKLHHEAMEFADAADLAQRRGELDLAESLHHQAFEKERDAANAIADKYDLEPTRSVLHRSAVSLALICKQNREAKRLITRALSANPPAEIANELQDLLKIVLQLDELKQQASI